MPTAQPFQFAPEEAITTPSVLDENAFDMAERSLNGMFKVEVRSSRFGDGAGQPDLPVVAERRRPTSMRPPEVGPGDDRAAIGFTGEARSALRDGGRALSWAKRVGGRARRAPELERTM